MDEARKPILRTLVPLATASFLIMALPPTGVAAPGPIESNPVLDGQQVVLALGMPVGPAQDGRVPRIEPAECVTRALVDANAECYVFFGQEDRDDPNGTIVELPVGVIAPESEGDPPNPDPVFFFPGGPGLSPMRAVSSLLTSGRSDSFDWIRNDIGDRPLVLIDHRGFPHAKPTLPCPGRTISPYQNDLSPVTVSSTDTMERLRLHTETVERCYQKLVDQGVDVTKYNEYDISRDVEEIRRLLGYDKINIYGYSTGGGTVIAYLRYYPDSVRSMVFGAPWFGEYRNRAAIDEFYTLKQTYTDILGLCVAQNPHCRELIPAWYHEIDRARRVLDKKPYIKTVKTEDGETVTLSFDGVAFMGKIYRRFENVYMKLPNVISRIQRQDYSALDDFFETHRWTKVSPDDTDDRQPYGYYLAHVCGDMGRNRPTKQDVIAMLEREPALLAFEDNKICAWWGADGAVPPEHNDRLYSEVPGLSLHGQVDSCCILLRWGTYLAGSMPNLQLVELQALGHGLAGECRPKLVASFLEEPYAKVDDSCKNDVPLGPWVFE